MSVTVHETKVDINSDAVPGDYLVTPPHLSYWYLSQQENLWIVVLLHCHQSLNTERMCLTCFDRYLMFGWLKKFFTWPQSLILTRSCVQYCQGRLPGGDFNSKWLSGLFLCYLCSLFFRSWKKSASFVIWGAVAWRKKESMCLYAFDIPVDLFSPHLLFFFSIKRFILAQPRCSPHSGRRHRSLNGKDTLEKGYKNQWGFMYVHSMTSRIIRNFCQLWWGNDYQYIPFN